MSKDLVVSHYNFLVVKWMFVSVLVLKYVHGPGNIASYIHRLQFCKVNTEMSIADELSQFCERKTYHIVVSVNSGALK